MQICAENETVRGKGKQKQPRRSEVVGGMESKKR